MTRAISRVSHQEPKDYLGVQFQQGRPILDADLNEAQSILLSQLRRLGAVVVGEGTPDDGFAIGPAWLASQQDVDSVWDRYLEVWFGPLRFFLGMPGDLLDDFESADEFIKTPLQGRIQVANDRPYQGDGFLRVSGHADAVAVYRTLDEPRDLSGYEVATFRYRLNRPVAGSVRFFMDDVDGNRTVWPCATLASAADTWLVAFAAPLDPSFAITTTELPQAELGSNPMFRLYSYGSTGPVSWKLLSGQPGSPRPADNDLADTLLAFDTPPTSLGRITFTIQATDDASGAVATRELFIDVVESRTAQIWGDINTNSGWDYLEQPETPTGTPANLAAIHRYGFELSQDRDTPLVWDLDDLRLGSSALREASAENDFVIRGSRDNDIRAQMVLAAGCVAGSGGPEFERALATLKSDLNGGPGHFYLAGLPCVQEVDVRYSHQADPNDPPLTPPPAGQQRIDTVYLDAWTEPVTFVQDPAIREVALGGIDTSTRERVRYRVRVAQGAGVPPGDGRGLGVLTTEGSYSAAANRLYRVEIDQPGDIGEATFRWSRENASVVARVIESVPPGSTTVVVEDASAFHPGDLILLSKESGAERHEVQQVLGNVITLATPTGGQLAELPGAVRPGFTTFALEDRPMVQRWDGFAVAIQPDPNDGTVSTSIPLEDGIRLRFDGSQMLVGDYWNFTTRYLAGDAADGVDPVSRIEQLDLARPHGVRHHYAPLAELVRDGSAERPSMISRVRDRRRASGRGPRAASGGLHTAVLNSMAEVHLGGLRTPGYSPASTFLVTWSGMVVLKQAASLSGSTLSMRVAFYDDGMTDPQAEPYSGMLISETFWFSFTNRPVGYAGPFSYTNVSNHMVPSIAPDGPISPTSVQVFAFCNTSNFTVNLSDMRLSMVEFPNHQ